MTAFLITATALTLSVAIMLLWPWLARRRSVADATSGTKQRREANRSIYTERLEQIEAELNAGRLSEEQAQALRDEAGQHLVEDIAQSTDTTGDEIAQKIQGRPYLGMLIVLLGLPLMSVAMYLQSDSWLLIGQSDKEPAWAYLTKQLEKRLAETPTDNEALLMLARTQRAQGNTAAAIASYAQLNAQTQYRVAGYLADEAETRILAAQGAFSPIAVERLKQALAANSKDGRALWYLGLSALSQGDRDSARKHWLKLSEQQLPDNFRSVLNQQLSQLGVPAKELSPEGSQGPNTATSPQLRLKISAQSQLIQGLGPETPVFVMARPADGSRAMLAVRKHRLDELPLETVLTDGMNMAGGQQLSDHDAYQITVRIAVSGDALPQTGDPYTEAKLAGADIQQPVELIIDKRLP